MTPAKATNRTKGTAQNGHGPISSVKGKAGDAASVVGSGAKKTGSGARKVVGAVAKNPLLAATGAVMTAVLFFCSVSLSTLARRSL